MKNETINYIIFIFLIVLSLIFGLYLDSIIEVQLFLYNDWIFYSLVSTSLSLMLFASVIREKKSYEVDLSYLSYFKGTEVNGVLKGEYTIKNKNDILIEKGIYYNGTKAGAYQKFYPTGILKEEAVRKVELGIHIEIFEMFAAVLLTTILGGNVIIGKLLLSLHYVWAIIIIVSLFYLFFFFIKKILEKRLERKWGGGYTGDYIKTLYYESGKVKEKQIYQSFSLKEASQYYKKGQIKMVYKYEWISGKGNTHKYIDYDKSGNIIKEYYGEEFTKLYNYPNHL